MQSPRKNYVVFWRAHPVLRFGYTQRSGSRHQEPVNWVDQGEDVDGEPAWAVSAAAAAADWHFYLLKFGELRRRPFAREQHPYMSRARRLLRKSGCYMSRRVERGAWITAVHEQAELERALDEGRFDDVTHRIIQGEAR